MKSTLTLTLTPTPNGMPAHYNPDLKPNPDPELKRAATDYPIVHYYYPIVHYYYPVVHWFTFHSLLVQIP